MYQIDFTKPVWVHFIGIGGISMSGLAEVLLGASFRVTGSDSMNSPLVERLRGLGAEIAIGQSADNISPEMDCVVYTAAIHADNPEFAAAKENNLPMLTRAELLGQIMKNYGTPVAVAGTHGKTTTTSMAGHIMLAGGLDPTISVGGIMPAIHGNIRVGNSDSFITEACEYTNSFLSFFPKIEIILNVDADHLDFFKDLDDIASSFHRFAQLLPADGLLIMNRDSNKFDAVTEGLVCPVLTYSLQGDADCTAADISFDESGCASFTCLFRGKEFGRYELGVPGMHNVSNALAVIALGRSLGIPVDCIKKGLSEFRGTERRFEYKGNYRGVSVVDDYAHHPTEISATLTAAEKYPHKELWVVFQPHTYTRTQLLLPSFAEALSAADHVVLAPIYAAREVNTIGISSDAIRELLDKAGTHAVYIETFDEIEEYLKTHLREGDLLITMGAGNIVEVGESLLRS